MSNEKNSSILTPENITLALNLLSTILPHMVKLIESIVDILEESGSKPESIEEAKKLIESLRLEKLEYMEQ